jgi:hypothetical protein
VRPLNRPLHVFLCVSIVAAIQLPLAAAVVVSEDVPVPGGTESVARALGLDITPDRARFAGEIMRFAYNIPEPKNPRVEEWLQQFRTDRHAPAKPAAPPAAELVPIPLTAAIWSEAVFHRRVTADVLFQSIVADRQAALVCRGLTALDDETLAFLAEHPAVLKRLYERDAVVFAAFSSSLRIHDNRIVSAGAATLSGKRDEIDAMWEAVVGEKTSRPDRFVAQLFDRADGRVAYLYDAIADLDAPHAAFALGTWMRRDADRLDRFKALIHQSSDAFSEWHPRALPSARPIFDIATMLDRVSVDATGAPRAPASLAVWARVFKESLAPGGAAGDEAPRNPADSIDAAWLATSLAGDIHQRSDRLDQLSFGQRVFTSAPADDAKTVASVLREFPRCRMLLLTLDRLSITDPSTYAAAIRTAGRLSELDGSRGFVALAQFQSTLAMIVRLRRVRAIDQPRAEAMLREVIAIPIGPDGYAGAMARWIAKAFRPIEGDVEGEIIARLAGPRADPRTAPRVVWEGQRYRLDLARAEERRLGSIRERQAGVSVDVAVGLENTIERMNVDSPDIAGGVGDLRNVASAVQAQTRREFADREAPAGLALARSIGDALQRAISDLTKIGRSKEPRKAAHAVEPLAAAADSLLADALLSIVYAIDIGDPDGTALLAGNVAHRHDFGLTLLDREMRVRTAWSLPRQEVAPGVPWHVVGSALGLDVGLASLSLRRVDMGRIGGAPRLTSNERQTFAASVALLNPSDFDERDRDAIVGGVLRGRRRVAAVIADPTMFDAAANDIRLDPRRRRAIRWSLSNDRDRVESMFSLTELLYLGGVPESSLDAWGMSGLPSAGCLCTRLSPPGAWTHLTGRPQLGLLATAVADLNLRIAIVLHDLQLPAAIERHVLSAAMQDFVDDVAPSDTDDWLTLVRAAQRITREQVEDYVAAVAADGPLVPDAGADMQGRR